MTKANPSLGTFNVAQIFWWMVTRDETTTLDLRRGSLIKIEDRVEPPTVPISGKVRKLKIGTTFSVCVVGRSRPYRQCYQAIVEKGARWSAHISVADACSIRDATAHLAFDDPAIPNAADPEPHGGPMRQALDNITVDAPNDEVLNAALACQSSRSHSRWEGPNACIEANFTETMEPVVAACRDGDLVADGVRPDGVSELLSPEVWTRNCFHLSGPTGIVTHEGPGLATLLSAHNSGADIRLIADVRQMPFWRDVRVAGKRVIELWPKEVTPPFLSEMSMTVEPISLDQLVKQLLAEDKMMPQKKVYQRVKEFRRGMGHRAEVRRDVEVLVRALRGKLLPGPRGPRKRSIEPPA